MAELRIYVPLIGNLRIDFNRSFRLFKGKVSSSFHRTVPPTITYSKSKIPWNLSSTEKEKSIATRKEQIATDLTKALTNLSLEIKINRHSKNRRNQLIDEYNNLASDIQALFQQNLSMVDSESEISNLETSLMNRIKKIQSDCSAPSTAEPDRSDTQEYSIHIPLLGTFEFEFSPLSGNNAEIQPSAKRADPPTIEYKKNTKRIWNKNVQQFENKKETTSKEMSLQLNNLCIKILTADNILQKDRNKLLEKFNLLKIGMSDVMQSEVSEEKTLTRTKEIFDEQIQGLTTELTNLIEKKQQDVTVEKDLPLEEKIRLLQAQTFETLASTNKAAQDASALTESINTKLEYASSYFSAKAWWDYAASWWGSSTEEQPKTPEPQTTPTAITPPPPTTGATRDITKNQNLK